MTYMVVVDRRPVMSCSTLGAAYEVARVWASAGMSPRVVVSAAPFGMFRSPVANDAVQPAVAAHTGTTGRG